MSDLPQRIQRSRKKGFRMPDGAIYVGRPTKWGNPFRVVPDDSGDRDGFWVEGPGRSAFFAEFIPAAEYAVQCFTYALCAGELGITVNDVRRELRGHPLACWCPLLSPCHGLPLLEISNA
jgi:hypothetical protein